MKEQIKHKLQRSLDKELFIEALNDVLDTYCDVRKDNAGDTEKRYLNKVITYGIIKEIETPKESEVVKPTSYE